MMLFSYYKEVYITEDKRTIRTGKFSYRPAYGFYLTNVDIEESQDEIKIHGWLRKFRFCYSYHVPPTHDYVQEYINDCCITDKDFDNVPVKK